MAVIIKELILILLLPLILTSTIDARSGCCSHHGGVCGCGCCDGTGLSATCLPYYPECSGGGISIPTSKPVILYPTNTPYPTFTPIPLPTSTSTPIPTIVPTQVIITSTPTPAILGSQVSDTDNGAVLRTIASISLGLFALMFIITKFKD